MSVRALLLLFTPKKKFDRRSKTLLCSLRNPSHNRFHLLSDSLKMFFILLKASLHWVASETFQLLLFGFIEQLERFLAFKTLPCLACSMCLLDEHARLSFLPLRIPLATRLLFCHSVFPLPISVFLNCVRTSATHSLLWELVMFKHGREVILSLNFSFFLKPMMKSKYFFLIQLIFFSIFKFISFFIRYFVICYPWIKLESIFCISFFSMFGFVCVLLCLLKLLSLFMSMLLLWILFCLYCKWNHDGNSFLP